MQAKVSISWLLKVRLPDLLDISQLFITFFIHGHFSEEDNEDA